VEEGVRRLNYCKPCFSRHRTWVNHPSDPLSKCAPSLWHPVVVSAAKPYPLQYTGAPRGVPRCLPPGCSCYRAPGDWFGNATPLCGPHTPCTREEAHPYGNRRLDCHSSRNTTAYLSPPLLAASTVVGLHCVAHPPNEGFLLHTTVTRGVLVALSVYSPECVEYVLSGVHIRGTE
jgi:hypothetical protein